MNMTTANRLNRHRKGENGELGLSVDVRNFGPIKEGRVELRPLTVFAGPSNTGKSWLSTLIYIMAEYPNSVFWSDRFYEICERLCAKQPFPNDPRRWWNDINESGTVELSEGENKIVRQAMESSLKEFLKEEFLRCYGGTQLNDSLIRHGHNGPANVTVCFGDVIHNIIFQNKRNQILVKLNIPKKQTVSLSRTGSMIIDRIISENNKKISHFSSQRILQEISRYIFTHKNFDSAYYLPADRGGIMHAHAAVVSALIENAPLAGLRDRPGPPALSGILSDFLKELISLGHNSPKSRRMIARQRLNGIISLGHNSPKSRRERSLAKKLERRILGGSVDIEKSQVGYPHFLYSPKGWKKKLPLMNSSSMVSELAPVALYLRHRVKPGDLLILEEPEAHLHPSLQQEFTEEIADWVNGGVRVILTTHSDWVLEKLSNMVAHGEIKKETGSVLKKEDVGVWMFDYANPKNAGAGSKIREVKWEVDEGGYEAGFYDVAVKVQNEWAKAINFASDEEMRT